MITVKRSVAALALVGAISLGCAGMVDAVSAKPVPADKLDYVGSWTGGPITLTLTADGMCSYRNAPQDGMTSEVNAPIQLWHATGFDVGIGPLVTTYTVSEAPHQLDGTWHMTLDGQDLTR